MSKLLLVFGPTCEGEIFTEKELDMSKWTIRGHANLLIDEWRKRQKGVYLLDNYNAVLLDQLTAVRVME